MQSYIISLTEYLIRMLHITNPIMIVQVKHFIHSSYFDSFGRRLHSDLLDRLERATIRSRQAERFSRDTVLKMYFLPLRLLFLLLFFCSGNRNAKDAEMKRVLPSTIRRPHRLPPQLDCSVFVSSRSSFSFVPRVSRCSRHSQNEEKRNSQSKFSRQALALVGYYFYSVSSLVVAWTMSPFEHPFIYESFCIIPIVSSACTWSELVRISTEPSSNNILPRSTISPTRTSCVHLLVPSVQS